MIVGLAQGSGGSTARPEGNPWPRRAEPAPLSRGHRTGRVAARRPDPWGV